tara:strand:+ start:1013 stop:1594 length:582 start_codon:yes stop_codon:yes gene_type:complete
MKMSTSYSMGKRAQDRAFRKASSLLAAGGPSASSSAAKRRQYAGEARDAAGRELGSVAGAVAQTQLTDPRTGAPGQQTPADIARQQAEFAQAAQGAAADRVTTENQAMMEQARKTVAQEMAERRARRAKALAIGASLALPAAGPLAGVLGGVATEAAEGSFKRNLAGGAEKYLQNLQAMYGGSGSNDDDDGDS